MHTCFPQCGLLPCTCCMKLSLVSCLFCGLINLKAQFSATQDLLNNWRVNAAQRKLLCTTAQHCSLALCPPASLADLNPSSIFMCFYTRHLLKLSAQPASNKSLTFSCISLKRIPKCQNKYLIFNIINHFMVYSWNNITLSLKCVFLLLWWPSSYWNVFCIKVNTKMSGSFPYSWSTEQCLDIGV